MMQYAKSKAAIKRLSEQFGKSAGLVDKKAQSQLFA